MSDALAAPLDRFASVRVLIVGDVMLDEYLWGDATRLSAEAPVPVVNVRRRTLAPGGAANAAANVRSLGAVPLLVGVTGADANASALREELQRHGIDPRGLIADESRPTTVKSRLVAEHHQVARFDVEAPEPLSAAIAARVSAALGHHLDSCEAVLVCDYAKGAVTAEVARLAIEGGRTRGRPIVVDPKGDDYGRYLGATLITPNVRETEQATRRSIRDEPDLLGAARELAAAVDAAVLVTRGSLGMTLVQTDRHKHFAAVVRAVYDVTGAGDTVAATLAVALGAGATLEEAAHLSNLAGGVVVGKFGTATVTVGELEVALREMDARGRP